jgi:hypothetical protein
MRARHSPRIGDDDQRLIRTIPRGGYMLVANVEQQPPAPFGEPSPPLTTGRRARELWRRLSSAQHRARWAAGVIAVIAAIALVGLAVIRGADVRHAAGGAGARVAPPLSIAVLPLVNIDGDPAHEYFADGLTSDLSTDLGRASRRASSSATTARAATRASRSTRDRSDASSGSATCSKAACSACTAPSA